MYKILQGGKFCGGHIQRPRDTRPDLDVCANPCELGVEEAGNSLERFPRK